MSGVNNDLLDFQRVLFSRGYGWHTWEVPACKHRRGSVIFKHAETGPFFACHFTEHAVTGACVYVTWFVGGKRYSCASRDIARAAEGVLSTIDGVLAQVPEKQTDVDLRLTEDAANFNEPD